MNILFLSHYYPPESNAPASRTSEHCLRWARSGHEVTVLTCVPNCPEGVAYPGYRNRWWPQTETINGVHVVRIWTYLAPNAGTIRRIVNYVSYLFSAVLASLLVRRPDVVVATSPQFFCGWAGVLVSWIKWRPLVLEIRDIWPESIRAVGAMQNGLLLRVLEKLERWMYRAADHIVAVGPGYRDEILKKVDVRGRISVITNGVDLDLFDPTGPDGEVRREYRLKGKFVCSYVGTVGMAHGLEVVVRAACLLKEQRREDIVFLVVGDGARRQSLIDDAKRFGVEDMVLFTGRQPKDRMPAILAASDACLIHLRGCELFGTVIPSKIFETMAMGRPIIMGVKGEACDIVLDAGAGIEMEPDSPESLVQCLEKLADSPELTSELSSSGRQYVAKHYNRDLLAKRFMRLLEELAGKPPVVLLPAKRPRDPSRASKEHSTSPVLSDSGQA